MMEMVSEGVEDMMDMHEDSGRSRDDHMAGHSSKEYVGTYLGSVEQGKMNPSHLQEESHPHSPETGLFKKPLTKDTAPLHWTEQLRKGPTKEERKKLEQKEWRKAVLKPKQVATYRESFDDAATS